MRRSIYPHLPSEQEAKNNFLHADFIPIYYNSQYTSNNPIPTWQFCTQVFVNAIGENHKQNFFPPGKRTCFIYMRETMPAAAAVVVKVKGEVPAHTMTANREVEV
jgi:hypothetical protein